MPSRPRHPSSIRQRDTEMNLFSSSTRPRVAQEREGGRYEERQTAVTLLMLLLLLGVSSHWVSSFRERTLLHYLATAALFSHLALHSRVRPKGSYACFATKRDGAGGVRGSCGHLYHTIKIYEPCACAVLFRLKVAQHLQGAHKFYMPQLDMLSAHTHAHSPCPCPPYVCHTLLAYFLLRTPPCLLSFADVSQSASR